MRWLVALALAGCHGGGSFDHDRFDGIVEVVRPRVTTVGERYRFQLDDSLDPSSLAAVPDNAMMGRGDGRGRVRATITANHKLAVSIETEDRGHAGEDGFMYVDAGFPPNELEGIQLDSQHETRIDDRWVRWNFDMD